MSTMNIHLGLNCDQVQRFLVWTCSNFERAFSEPSLNHEWGNGLEGRSKLNHARNLNSVQQWSDAPFYELGSNYERSEPSLNRD